LPGFDSVCLATVLQHFISLLLLFNQRWVLEHQPISYRDTTLATNTTTR
jgi:hypothetical protein